MTHTPGPWEFDAWGDIRAGHDTVICAMGKSSGFKTDYTTPPKSETAANARLIAAAPEMLEALRLHKAWTDSERAGPDYGGQSRDTHPDGEAIWRKWWDYQLDICDRAGKATDAAIAKAEGRT